MFQSFSNPSQKEHGPARIAALRKQMQELDIDAFIVPHTDEHQNEYLPPRAERLAWLTGFTGSAGTAVVTKDEAIVFTDGRYTLQVKNQTDQITFRTRDSVSAKPGFDMAEWAQKGMKIGVDPWLHTMAELDKLQSTADANKAELILLNENPVDEIWADQPPAPSGTIKIHDVAYAGVAPKRKISDIKRAVRAGGAAAVVLTDPNSICWLFNIRGNDVVHTPLALAFAIVPVKGDPQLFVAPEKLNVRERAYLTQLCDLHDPEAFLPHLELLGEKKAKVQLDPSLVAAQIANILEENGAQIVKKADPCRLPRARKNRVERKGAIEAHKRDGAAMTTFLAWLSAQSPDDLNEIKVAKKLEQCRRETGDRLGGPMREISFDTISGSGPNGAIVHYRVNEDSNRQVEDGDLFLLDSGAQYDDGTTDITRVVAIGTPTKEQRRHFTLVLKGMIAISQVRFPSGTRGVDLDVLARRALWAEGLDYAHGTGHGVGSFLGVHEGPQGISKRAMTPFETGMIVSNEPGYYKEGSHGIRIENLVIVDAPKLPKSGEIEMHGFTTLTLCPIDQRLIEFSLLNASERRWLNRYHAKVRRELSKLIDDEGVLAWLEQATARLTR